MMKNQSPFLWGTLYIVLVSVLLVPYRALGETSIEFNISNANYEVFVSDSRPLADNRLEADVRASLASPDFEFEVTGIATASDEATLVASALLAVGIMGNRIEAVKGQTLELESLGLSFTVTRVVSDETNMLEQSGFESLIAALEPAPAVAILGSPGQSLDGAFLSAREEYSSQDAAFASCVESRGRLRVSVATVIIDNNQFRRVIVTDSDGQPVEGAHVTAIFPNHTNPSATQDILITNLTDALGGAYFAGAPFLEQTNFYAVATSAQDSGGVVCKLETPPGALDGQL